MLLHPTPDTITLREREAESLSSTFPSEDYHAWLSINETHSDEEIALATLTVDFSAAPGESLKAALKRALESLISVAI